MKENQGQGTNSFEKLRLLYVALSVIACGNKDFELILLSAFVVLTLENIKDTPEEMLEALGTMYDSITESLEQERMSNQQDGQKQNG